MKTKTRPKPDQIKSKSVFALFSFFGKPKQTKIDRQTLKFRKDTGGCSGSSPF